MKEITKNRLIGAAGVYLVADGLLSLFVKPNAPIVQAGRLIRAAIGGGLVALAAHRSEK